MKIHGLRLQCRYKLWRHSQNSKSIMVNSELVWNSSAIIQVDLRNTSLEDVVRVFLHVGSGWSGGPHQGSVRI